MLEGKKTYIVAASYVLMAVGAYLQGQVDLGTAIQQVLVGLGFATLRMGVANK